MLENNPHMERKLNIEPDFVIVAREDWHKAKDIVSTCKSDQARDREEVKQAWTEYALHYIQLKELYNTLSIQLLHVHEKTIEYSNLDRDSKHNAITAHNEYIKLTLYNTIELLQTIDIHQYNTADKNKVLYRA